MRDMITRMFMVVAVLIVIIGLILLAAIVTGLFVRLVIWAAVG